jgi:hypothetical protein
MKLRFWRKPGPPTLGFRRGNAIPYLDIYTSTTNNKTDRFYYGTFGEAIRASCDHDAAGLGIETRVLYNPFFDGIPFRRRLLNAAELLRERNDIRSEIIAGWPLEYESAEDFFAKYERRPA